MSENAKHVPQEPVATGDRREFLKKTACGVLGGVCVLAPVAAGVAVALDPLLRSHSRGVFVRLTTLDLLPLGGPPRRFEVIDSRSSAWTKYPRAPIGSVYLHRVGEREVRAFNTSCPHLGCAVDFEPDRHAYFCPCHQSDFALDGAQTAKSPSARPLDSLAVEIRPPDEVWVQFQNFKAGIKEKIPVA
jgi:menaquinol-cytochrome c reductase iron-sulfur subunit